MRVIAGQNRGMKLDAPKGDSTRPTTDRVRESLFNILENHIIPENVLDLYAGSGAIGIECISRYSSNVTFVENNRSAIEIIRKNLIKIKNTVSEVRLSDSIKFLESAKGKVYDFIYIDPPYEVNGLGIISDIIAKDMASSIIVYETDNLEYVSDVTDLISSLSDFEIIKERKYGRTYLLFIEKIG